MELFVSTEGDDNWSGSLREPDANGSDGPLATLGGARDRIRPLVKALTEDITVFIGPGTYTLTESLVFGLEDSPAPPFTVSYCASEPGETVISSADRLSGWRRFEGTIKGLPEKAEGKLWTTEAPGRRIYTLYDGNRRLRRAREPGFLPDTDLLRSEWEPIQHTLENNELAYPEGALRDRDNLEDIELMVRPMWPWIVNILRVESVDEEKRLARTSVSATYPISRLRFGVEESEECCWVENTPEGLDRPGSWMLQDGKIYLWPIGSEPGQILAPRLVELIRIEGDSDNDNPVRGIRFTGLTFSHAERETLQEDDAGLQHDWDFYDKGNALVRLRGAAECEIRGCHFRSSGGGGIRLDLHCQDNVVADSLLEDLGGTGVLLCGYGPGRKDVSKRNRILNNHIHHCGRIWWHAPGIFIWQSGENLVANNLIHDLAYNAVVISGVRPIDFARPWRRECSRTVRRDEVGDAVLWDEILPFLHARNNVFEDNEIHHAMQYMADGNAIYISGSGEGNIIRRNFIHDMGAKTIGQSAIRTDGWQRGTLITENLIYDCACGIVRKNYNHVENNIIVNTREDLGAISFRHFPDDEETQGARVMRNICYQDAGPTSFYEERGGQPKSGKYTRPEHCRCNLNIFFDAGMPERSEAFVAEQQAQGLDGDSLVVDPMLADPVARGITPLEGSPAYGLGFKPIDAGKIGLTPSYPEHLRGRYSDFQVSQE